MKEFSQEMNSEHNFLVDLPELVLAEIAKRLLPCDLANTLQTCTKLRKLLRPRQNAMVRSRLL